MTQTIHAAPIISSQALDWKLLIVEEFQQPPGGIDKPEAWKRHAIAIMSEGDISITPAGLPAAYRAAGEDRYLQI